MASDWIILYDGITNTNWLNGYVTPAFPNDDIYQVSKNSKSTYRNNRRYSAATVIPIVKKFNCKWITSETFDITPSVLAARRIGFGAGDCDPSVPITINRNKFNLEME